MDSSFEVEKFYIQMKEKLLEENRYIKSNEDIDYAYINKIVMDKKIIKDKIEKKTLEAEEIEESVKKRIRQIIAECIVIEEENSSIYRMKIGKVKEEIQNLNKEKKLKDAYIKVDKSSFYVDEKK